jgi:hypothetical protein
VSSLSRECGILNISHSYWPPRPVTGIALAKAVMLDVPCVDVACSTRLVLSKHFPLGVLDLLSSLYANQSFRPLETDSGTDKKNGLLKEAEH